MNDDTLREKVDTEFKRIDGGEVMPIYNRPTAVAHVMEFIHQYAQAYAESIIGQDEPGVTNVMIAMEHNHQRTLNNQTRGELA